MEDYSKDFIDYIKRFEDFKDTAYNLNNEKWPDGSLKYTIGYGTTVYEDGTPVKKGDKITKEAAEAAIPVYLNSKIPHIKEYITNWDKLPQQAKEGIFSIVYRGGGLRKSPKFAQALNSAYEDGWMTTDEYQKVIAEMNFSLTGNLQDRMQRNAALIGGMYDYADNSTINYATTHKSPYLNYNNNVFFKGNKWNARWEDIQHMNESPANFVERLKDPNRKHIDLGNGYIGTHLMSYADGPDGKYIMYPNIQEVKSYPWYDFFHIGSPNKELIKFEGEEAFDRAVQTGDTVHILDPWTAEHYKQHYLTFKSGGLLNFKNMNYINYYKSGSGIHIKKANKGKFTDYCGGKVTSECIARGKHSSSAAVRKRATFAANARKWKHEDGGILKAAWGDKFVSWKDNVVESTRNNKERLKKLFTKDDNFDEIKNPFEQEQITPQASSTPGTLTWDDLNAAFNTPIQTTQQSSVSIPDNDRMKLAINYLVSKGLSKAGAAGAVGVFFAESGLTPGRTNEDEERKYGDKAGKGIAQWSNERRKGYDEYMKGKLGTLEDELDYFLQEVATSRPKVLDVLKSTSDVNEAVQAMHLGYENGTAEAFATPEQLTKIYTPAWEKLGYGKYNYQDSHNKRYGYAQTAYALV